MKTLLFVLLLTVWAGAQSIFDSKIYDASGRDYTLTKSGYTALFSTSAYFSGDSIFYSKPFELSRDGHKSTGSWGIAVKLDSIVHALATDPDTLYMWPEFWMGRSIGWVTGDTMRFHSRSGVVGASAYADTVTLLIDVTHHDNVYYWQTAPYDTFAVHSFPYQRVRVKGKIRQHSGGSFGINAELFYDER